MSLHPVAHEVLFESSERLWWVWGLILNAILSLLHLIAASPLPLEVGYLFLVGSNILLSMVVQQRVAILEFLQEKMSACPSTLIPEWEAVHFCCSKSPCSRYFEVNTALSVFSPRLPALASSMRVPWCRGLSLSRTLLAYSYLCAGEGGAHQSTNSGLPSCKKS